MTTDIKQLSQHASAQFINRRVRRSQTQRVLKIRLASGGYVDVFAHLHALANETLWLSEGMYRVCGFLDPMRWPSLTERSLLLSGKNAPYRRRSDIPDRVWEAAGKAIKAALAAGHENIASSTLAKRLNITAEFRAEHKLWQIGACDMTIREIRKKADRERDARRRLEAGATPRYASEAQTKPWEALGVSRRTYYTLKAKGKARDCTNYSADNSKKTLGLEEIVQATPKPVISTNPSAVTPFLAKPNLGNSSAQPRGSSERSSRTIGAATGEHRWWEIDAPEDTNEPSDEDISRQLMLISKEARDREWAQEWRERERDNTERCLALIRRSAGPGSLRGEVSGSRAAEARAVRLSLNDLPF